MVGSNVANYNRLFYNLNNNFFKISEEDSNALHFFALLFSSKSLLQLLFY